MDPTQRRFSLYLYYGELAAGYFGFEERIVFLRLNSTYMYVNRSGVVLCLSFGRHQQSHLSLVERLATGV